MHGDQKRNNVMSFCVLKTKTRKRTLNVWGCLLPALMMFLSLFHSPQVAAQSESLDVKFEAKLLAGDAQQQHWFGGFVGTDGTTAVLTAYGDSTNGPFSGAAYVFR